MIPILEISQSLLSNVIPSRPSSSENITKSSPTDYPLNSFPGISPSEQLLILDGSIERRPTFQLRPVELNDFVEALQTLQGRDRLEAD